MKRQRVLVERGLSNGQAQRLSRELAGRGVPVECTLSPLCGWDVWVYQRRDGAGTDPVEDASLGAALD